MEDFPEEFMPPPLRDDFVIRNDMSQNNLIQDKGSDIKYFRIFFKKINPNILNI